MSAWEVLREAPRRFGLPAVPARPQLRSLPRPARRLTTVPFVALMIALVAAGTVGVLYFVTVLQSQAFEIREAKRQAAELAYTVSDLESQLYRVQAPAQLARRAAELGMVPNPHGVFVDLVSGRIIGDATPVRGDELPSLLDPTGPAPDPEAGTDADATTTTPTATPAPAPADATATPVPMGARVP